MQGEIQDLQGAKTDADSLHTSLTNREMEVLRLIAQGLSNGDIAGLLVIGEQTVKGHVSNILGKLQLADRTQAAVYAWEKGVVRRNETLLSTGALLGS